MDEYGDTTITTPAGHMATLRVYNNASATTVTIERGSVHVERSSMQPNDYALIGPTIREYDAMMTALQAYSPTVNGQPMHCGDDDGDE